MHETKSTAIRHAIFASVNLVLGWAKEGKKGARFSGHEVHNFQRKQNKGAVRSQSIARGPIEQRLFIERQVANYVQLRSADEN